MKKVLLFLAAAAMIFAGCKSKEEVTSATETEFTVSLQPNKVAKAPAADDSKYVDEVVLIVWDYAENKEYTRITNTGNDLKLEADGTITTTFKLALKLGGYYEYLFWADNAGYYDLTRADSIVAVESMAKANDIKRDAFCTMWKDESKYTAPIVKSFTLTRPFAQFNLVATDITRAIREAQFPKDNLKFAIEYEGYQGGIDLTKSTDLLSDDKITIKDTVTAFYDTLNNQAVVIMDYLWMPIADDKELFDISFASILPTEFDRDFASVPFQRNYKTNLIGELFFKSSEFTVTVDPMWLGSDTIPYTIPEE